VQQHTPSTGAFARPCWRRTQPALKVAHILIGIRHEMAAAFAALGAAQHIVVDKLHQTPGARDGWPPESLTLCQYGFDLGYNKMTFG